jgi:hypothetical protein
MDYSVGADVEEKPSRSIGGRKMDNRKKKTSPQKKRVKLCTFN